VPDQYLANYSGSYDKGLRIRAQEEYKRYKESLPDSLLTSFFSQTPNLDSCFLKTTKLGRYIDKYTCVFCSKVHDERGWVGLCNRQCYHDLANLLDEYNQSTNDFPPDDRLIFYFTRYPESPHTFVDRTRITEYIEKHTCVYCSKLCEEWGWVNLCDRQCYHGLSNLLTEYELSTDDKPPDERLVTYFSRYPESPHTFVEQKRIRKYLEETDALCARIYEEQHHALIC